MAVQAVLGVCAFLSLLLVSIDRESSGSGGVSALISPAIRNGGTRIMGTASVHRLRSRITVGVIHIRSYCIRRNGSRAGLVDIDLGSGRRILDGGGAQTKGGEGREGKGDLFHFRAMLF